MPIGRNDPCPCGSGQKYKRCCEGKKLESGTPARGLVILVGFLLVLGVGGLGAALLRDTSQSAGLGRVWSEEHGHWHDAGAPVRGAMPAPEDLGAGRIWSEEHGHWHGADGSELGAPAPPGQVWSEEHGHYHAADGSELGAAPAPAASDGVWSEEHGHWHGADGGVLGAPPP